MRVGICDRCGATARVKVMRDRADLGGESFAFCATCREARECDDCGEETASEDDRYCGDCGAGRERAMEREPDGEDFRGREAHDYMVEQQIAAQRLK